MPDLAVLTDPLKMPDPDPEGDDFQNLMLSSLSTDTSLVTFSRKSNQYFQREVGDKQTN